MAQKEQTAITRADDQAFATPEVIYEEEAYVFEKRHPGLSKREFFAALALQGLLANPSYIRPASTHFRREFSPTTAEVAVLLADELIEALNRFETPEDSEER